MTGLESHTVIRENAKDDFVRELHSKKQKTTKNWGKDDRSYDGLCTPVACVSCATDKRNVKKMFCPEGKSK